MWRRSVNGRIRRLRDCDSLRSLKDRVAITEISCLLVGVGGWDFFGYHIYRLFCFALLKSLALARTSLTFAAFLEMSKALAISSKEKPFMDR